MIEKGSKEWSRLESRIAGAIKSCIDAHGPITKEWTGSAAKRAMSEFVSYLKEKDEQSG